jgi:hypothetical protein
MSQLPSNKNENDDKNANYYIEISGIIFLLIMSPITFIANVYSINKFNDNYATYNKTDELNSVENIFTAWIWIENILLILFVFLICLEIYLSFNRIDKVALQEEIFLGGIIFTGLFLCLAFFGCVKFFDKLIVLENDSVYINCIFSGFLMILFCIFICVIKKSKQGVIQSPRIFGSIPPINIKRININNTTNNTTNNNINNNITNTETNKMDIATSSQDNNSASASISYDNISYDEQLPSPPSFELNPLDVLEEKLL